jgi:hypothetical protein
VATYGRVDIRIWGDRRFRSLSPLPPCGQGLFLYLLAPRERCRIPGVIVAGRAALAESLKWSPEGFGKSFRELFREGMAKADWEAPLVWLPQALKHNPPANPNVVLGWSADWDAVPECPLKSEVWLFMKPFLERLGEGFAEAFRKGLPEPLPESIAVAVTGAVTLQEQEQEEEENNGGGVTAATLLAEGEKRRRKANPFVDSAWATYDTVDAPRPPAGLLMKWRKELFKGDSEWMLRALAGLSPRGALSKGDSYVYKALSNLVGNGQAEPAPETPPRPRLVRTSDETLGQHPDDPEHWLTPEQWAEKYPEEPWPAA